MGRKSIGFISKTREAKGRQVAFLIRILTRGLRIETRTSIIIGILREITLKFTGPIIRPNGMY